jgi:hypothetical protein
LKGKKSIIALDCDGVLLDYNLALAKHWGRFTGTQPVEIDPLSYWNLDRWNIQLLTVITFSYTIKLNDSGRFTLDTALARCAQKMSLNTFSTKKINL